VKGEEGDVVGDLVGDGVDGEFGLGGGGEVGECAIEVVGGED
jgi:hypothetical protein